MRPNHIFTFSVALFAYAIAAHAQIGNLDQVTCTTVSGWAWDQVDDNAMLVDIYDSNNLVATVTANQFRGDLAGAGIGNGWHAFSIATPGALLNGQSHSVSAKYHGTNTGLSNSPLSVSCSVIGYLDGIDSVHLHGWAYNYATDYPMTVDVYDGGNLVQSGVPANQYRSDLQQAGFGNGDHGFDEPTPNVFLDNQLHTVAVMFGGTQTNLNNSPTTLGPVSVVYMGYFDEIDSGTIAGWAWDETRPNTPIEISFYDGDSSAPFDLD